MDDNEIKKMRFVELFLNRVEQIKQDLGDDVDAEELVLQEFPKDQRESIKALINEYRDKVQMNKIVIKNKFTPRIFSMEIMKMYKFLYDSKKRFWYYDPVSGIWKENAEDLISFILRNKILGEESQKRYFENEIIADIKGLSWKDCEPEPPPPHLIPFKNCVYDLFEDKVRPFSSEMFFINKLNIEYDPEITECPTIDKIFHQLVRDKDVITLYEIIAYAMWRDYPTPKIFILYGSGGNGKTTYVKILERIFGLHNISTVSLSEFQNNQRFASGKLFGKYLNIAGEIDYITLQRTEELKKLTGGDLVQCERKFKSEFLFKNYAKIIFLTNQVPKTTDKTKAFFRRMFLVEFPYEFKEGVNANPLIIEDIPNEEFIGLANKCLKILKKLYERKFVFTNHVDVEVMMKRYEGLSNPLIKFINERCVKSLDEFVPKWVFRDAFFGWLKKKGFRIWTEKELSLEMKNLGFEDKRKAFGDNRYWCWIGLNLKEKTDLFEKFEKWRNSLDKEKELSLDEIKEKYYLNDDEIEKLKNLGMIQEVSPETFKIV